MIGVTAVEDLLQDNVASCICDFRKAGIRVWMLTGDKGETALQIGLSCGLYDEQFKLLKAESEEMNLETLQEL